MASDVTHAYAYTDTYAESYIGNTATEPGVAALQTA